MDIQESQVVEFLEGVVDAVCLGKKGTRFHLLTHLGRETNLSKNRVIHISSQRIKTSPREEAITILKEINELRSFIQKDIDIAEIWELLEGEDQVWNPREFSEIIFGEKSTPDHEAASIRAVITERTHFKFKDGFIRPQPKEAVERLIEQRRREEEKIKRLEQGTKLLNAIWGKDKSISEISDTSEWIEAIKDYCIQGEDSERSGEVKDLFKRAGLSSPIAPFETLVRAGIWSEDENIELLRAGIERTFSEEVIGEAKKISEDYQQKALSDETREDLRDLDVFTIDALQSKDLDDALSFREVDGGVEVGIHITDVGTFIRPGSRLFEIAMERATSIYLPDEIVPMLPESLSNETFSLLPEKERAALSFFALIDEEGGVRETRIVRSVIKSKRKMSYEEADELVAKEGTIKRLYDLALLLQKKRIKEGNALPLPIPELSIRVEDGQIRVWLDEPGPSRFLVSELMILANSIAAKFLRDNSIPALYRSQPEPRERIINGAEQDLRSNFRQRRLISRGILGPEPDFHSGLGLECYTTITSPIRRALDLAMQIQILEYLASSGPRFSQKELDGISINIQEGLIRAASVRQARFRYWLLKHLNERKGEDLKAWVLDILDNKLLLVLEDYLITVDIPRQHKMDYYLDQEVYVRIKKVNPRENQLKFEWGKM
ncbi:3'-to-5' exoribonuclease RNase R [Dissulfuribacter thermophilus]|uniref:3'-to-5' exoribonuclease RNase R n=1 Tax=Dissulfuribacter thermophilus TaxID=1156395 RepID=A0A1B9F617_9BACT|nr:ribonuclease catalytic domain-containing protein [Dissulfuribacter thermophilus]OCC15379.1 3'-to-5' exoribonuclease RNase R [Dissulfuribacter thermophilus]